MGSNGVSVVEDTWRVWVLRCLLALGMLAVLCEMPVWLPLQRLEYDLLNSLTAPIPPDVNVLVVGLDEPSLAALNQAPPLPRRFHARVVDALAAAGAAALGIDMLFGAPQSPSDDAALARSLQGSMPVVLASAVVLVQSSQVAQYQQTLPTVFPDARHGNVALQLDDDGVVRRAPTGEDALWRVLAQSAGRPITPPPPGALLRYYAPEVPVPYAHYTQAMDPAGTLPPRALQGKLVLMGQHTPVGNTDQFATPLRGLGGGMQSGVFLHATALINGLNGDWIVPAPPVGPNLQAVLVVGLVAGFTRRWRAWRALWLSVALALLAVSCGLLAYLLGLWWSVLPTLAGLALHLNVGAADSYLRERRRREQLRNEFARYVPPAVVDTLVSAGSEPAMRCERRVLSLLFSDLAGFTAASEHLPPETVAGALNAYFSRMTRTVHLHGGTLDKFIGDAVMAFWNAPLPDLAHAARALACAQAMQADMVLLRKEWHGTPFANVRMRIGVHTGDVAVGHLGSHERFTYTAVGDAVNTAARLEGANKVFGTEILLSSATLGALPANSAESARMLWLDTVILAGRSTGLDVLTVSDDDALNAISKALYGHLQSSAWAMALQCCEAWKAHAHAQAPQWVAHIDQLQCRVRTLALAQAECPAQSLGESPRFAARSLEKS